MITLTTPFIPEFTPYLPPDLQAKRALYFDIETTGLSAQSSYVYLIGCAYEEGGTYHLTCSFTTTAPALICRSLKKKQNGIVWNFRYRIWKVWIYTPSQEN